MKELKRPEDVKKILTSSKPVAVFFYMDGCPHCEAMVPIWSELEKETPNIDFLKVESASVPSDLGIFGYPKFIKAEGRKQVKTADGEMSKDELKNKLLSRGGRRRRNCTRVRRRGKRYSRATRRRIPF